jgi:hypothetical protein
MNEKKVKGKNESKKKKTFNNINYSSNVKNNVEGMEY